MVKKTTKTAPKKSGSAALLKEYARFLDHIKTDILRTQLRSALSVTKELTLLYWRIGNGLSEQSKSEKWGAKVIEKLARDITSNFPDLAGFSPRNLKYMKKFAEAYPDDISATAVALIPWGHNLAILEKLQDKKQRLWYAQSAIKNGWSRSSLVLWIESDLYSRQGKSITNFKATLPNPDSDIAQQTLKDPYNFNFLTIDKEAREREVEQGLMSHIRKFLLELGQGFAFIGNQYPLQVGNKEIFIDLLFYHIDLRSFIVVELKAGELDARDLGQINLYLSAVDSLLKKPEDKPSIGLLLCKSKDDIFAEYALRDMHKPIGISSYTAKLVESLPKELKGKLPSIEEIEAELEKKEVVHEVATRKPATSKTKKLAKKSDKNVG